MKIKHEQENYDYNHNHDNHNNTELHPNNIITQTRSHENQSRLNFTKTCSHEPFQSTTSTFMQTRSDDLLSTTAATFMQTRRDNDLLYSTPNPVVTAQQNSCLYQGSSVINQPSMATVGSPVANLQPSDIHNNNKPFDTWQQPELQRNNSSGIHTNELKSSCMMYNNYESSPLQHFNNTTMPQQITNTSRETRNSLSHMPTVSEMVSRQYSPPIVSNSHLYSPQANTFQPYNYNTIIDEKPDSYALQQAYNNQQGAANYQLPNAPSPIQPNPIGMVPHGMNHIPNSPIDGSPTFANAYHPHMMGPNMHPNNPMANPNMAEFPYNQAFYAREYRRPRRIACTCPNCRDGENKTVTTRDGKQKKQHICHVPGCGKVYGKTSHLRAHLRWHAGERPFACNWLFCNKRFTRSDELQRHRRTHTGDKRFECSICLKKFMRSDHLSKHMKTHQAQNNKNKDKTDPKASPEQAKNNTSKAENTTTNSQTLSTTNITNSLAL